LNGNQKDTSQSSTPINTINESGMTCSLDLVKRKQNSCNQFQYISTDLVKQNTSITYFL